MPEKLYTRREANFLLAIIGAEIAGCVGLGALAGWLRSVSQEPLPTLVPSLTPGAADALTPVVAQDYLQGTPAATADQATVAAAPDQAPTVQPTATEVPAPEVVFEQPMDVVFHTPAGDVGILDITPLNYDDRANSASYWDRFNKFDRVSLTAKVRGGRSMYVHTGYHGGVKNPGEDVRVYFEGQKLGVCDRNPAGCWYAAHTPEEERIKREELLGSKVTLRQTDREQTLRVVAVYEVQHSNVESFLTNVNEGVGKVLEYGDADAATAAAIEEFYKHDNGWVEIGCGWARENEVNGGAYSYTAILVFMVPEAAVAASP